jgi:hypothetical protein
MKKTRLGILLGIIAGVLDVIPMVIQKLSWDANISAFCFWIISGFIISTSNLKIKGALKGLIISLILIIPTAILIGWKEPVSLIPIVILNIIFGTTIGFLIDKFGK